MERTAAGDRRAFRSLFDAYYPVVYGFMRSLLHTEEDASDVAQEVFIKLWLMRAALPDITSLRFYLFRMSLHQTINYIKKKYNLLIGERTAEDIKIKIGSAYPYEGEGAMNIKGRNLMDGLPKNIEISAEEIREALSDSVNQILDVIKATLEKTPPELAADIIDHGIMLTGGGALLRGLDKLIAAETRIPVLVAESPLDCVVDGTGICLEHPLDK